MNRMAKRTLAWLIRPAADLAGKLAPLRRVWAYSRLVSAGLDPDVSTVVLGTPELHGTRRVRLGRELYLYPGLYLETRGSGEILIGDHAVISRGVHIVAFDGVAIGAGTMIGEYTSIRDANHRIVREGSIRDSGHEARGIAIGQNVWIGRGAMILPGVSIGDHAVVGANSVVTRDVPAGATVVGAPARQVAAREAA